MMCARHMAIGFCILCSHWLRIARFFIVPFLVSSYSGTVAFDPSKFAAVFPKSASVWVPALVTALCVPVLLWAARWAALYFGVCVLFLGPTPAGAIQMRRSGQYAVSGLIFARTKSFLFRSRA